MAVFSNTIITKKGHALVAKGMAGEQINFTKVRTSDYDYPSSTNFENLTVLGSIKQTVDISAVNIENESTVRVKAAILNKDLTSGYYVKNIGLYANDPDEGEILFSITTATTADFMPAYNGVNTSVLTVDLLTTVSNSMNVNLTVSPGGLVTTEMIARETERGISSFEEIRENTGMPNRGVLTLIKTITYKELWELPHGNYAINSEATLKFLGINGLYAAGILKVYKPNVATSEFLKMFVYISQTVEVPGALTGKATLTVFKNAAEQYADVPVTDNIAVWNEKWKKELSITSEEIKVGNTGFMKLANGIILQWGGDMKSSINGNDFRYFPIAFPQGCASATASYSSLESAGQGVSFQAVDRTKFLLGHRMGDGTLTQGMVYWTAIGY